MLKDKEGGHISSGGAGFSVPSVLPSIRPAAPMAYEHSAETESGVGLLSSRTYGSLLVSNCAIMKAIILVDPCMKGKRCHCLSLLDISSFV